MATCLVSLGSNLGDRRQLIEQAIARIDAHRLIRVTTRSRMYETNPIGGPPGQDSFFNAAIKLETSLPPDALLEFLQAVEVQLGRKRGERWAARTVDLDLLLYDREILSTDKLTLPHPRMHFRRFVLTPAAEIAEEMVHPDGSWSIGDLLQIVKSLPNYVSIAGPRKMSRVVATRVAESLEKDFAIRVTVLADPAFQRVNSSPTGLDYDGAIKFLQRRGKALRANWTRRGAWFISDFDFRTSLFIGSFIPESADADRRGGLAAKLGSMRAQLPSPKLACMLSGFHEMAPYDSLVQTDSEAREILATGAYHLRILVPRCPTLTLLGADEGRAVEELTAAILAMHEEPQLLP